MVVRKLAFYTACLASVLLVSSCGLNVGVTGAGSSLSITAPNNGISFSTKESASVTISGTCDKDADLVAVPDRPVVNNCAENGTWSFETGVLSGGPNTFSISTPNCAQLPGGCSNSGNLNNNGSGGGGSITISVIAESMTVTAVQASIAVGDTDNLRVHFWDASGAEIMIPNATAPHSIAWSVDNYVTVPASPAVPQENNVATGVSAGTATVTATLSFPTGSAYGYTGNLTASVPITVTGPVAPPLSADIATTMTVTADKTIINVGDTVNLQAHFWDINGAEITIPEPTSPHLITWSPGDPSIAIVAADSSPVSGELALATGQGGGTTNITADLAVIPTAYGYTGNTTASVAITVLGANTSPEIYVGGAFTQFVGDSSANNQHVSKLSSVVGITDDSFASGVGANANIYSLSLQGNGGLIIGGSFTSYAGTAVNGIARLAGDGSLDSRFNMLATGATGGISGYGASSAIYATAVDSDGNILIGGHFGVYTDIAYCDPVVDKAYNIARVDTFGDFDSAFGINTATLFTAADRATVYAIALQPDGKILIGGSFVVNVAGAAATNVARLNSDGTTDDVFNINIGNNMFGMGIVYALAVQSDGKILVGGSFGSKIARLNTDGSLDTTFNWNNNGADKAVAAIAIQADDQILIGGLFTTYSDSSVHSSPGLARLNYTDGSFDPTFSVGSGVAPSGAYVRALLIQNDGSVIFGGSFTSYNGTSRSNIAKVGSDGTLDTSFVSPGDGFNSIVYSIVPYVTPAEGLPAPRGCGMAK
jgi:uncharacterized delta-60 repeat protein